MFKASGVKKILKFGKPTDAPPLLIVVAGALIDTSGRVLVQQRPDKGSMAGLWEFPGGKVEAGEAPEAALIREFQEELGIVLATFQPLGFASAPLNELHLVMLLYVCHQWHGTPEPLHATALQWVAPKDLYTLPMPPADLPLIASIVAATQCLG